MRLLLVDKIRISRRFVWVPITVSVLTAVGGLLQIPGLLP
jgi:hypothetical protein